MDFWYVIADRAFVVFHTTLIFFNVFGWIWQKTRKLNLITLLLTGGSWGLLGIFYGFGYCPLTDWHWQVLHHLGKYDLPYSYIEYLSERLSGMDFQAELVNTLTYIIFSVVLIVSAVLNVRDYLMKRKRKYDRPD